ncbi:MAG TPA: XdhC family protein [Nocardia sp.]|uniref:XdhC family protein n=1 Tax=Nocardia TaxID=1817 RepID=UPI002455C403|nr:MULTISPECIES: XdhC/CoxI family protein [Nocardia]HLS77830.1 XdhC family protein [Nocardia sp.]
MRELAGQLTRWHAEGTPYALATVVGVRGSAPRAIGAVMAVDAAGTVRGSLSGGCVEGAVLEVCREVLATGKPVRERFGYEDADAFAVGLTCGGELEVFVQRVGAAEHPMVEAVLRRDVPVALVRDLGTGALLAVTARSTTPSSAGDARPPAVVELARAMLAAGATGVRTIGGGADQRTVLIESFTTRPRMIVFGATDFTVALCRVGALLGYRVTVCEARPAFADPARIPEADEVVAAWPHRYLRDTEVDARTVICVLTHDPKFDIPVLAEALRLPVAYVGAMGSRRTDRERRAKLRAAGVSERDLARLRSPIGLELGGRTPEETAVAIAAEIVALRNGGSARALSATDRPIHPRPVDGEEFPAETGVRSA